MITIEGWKFFDEKDKIKIDNGVQIKCRVSGNLFLVAEKIRDDLVCKIYKDTDYNRLVLLANDEFILAYENGHMSEMMLFADKLGEDISWDDVNDPRKIIIFEPKVHTFD